jgi:rubrerythrin
MEILDNKPDAILVQILDYLKKIHNAGEHVLAAYAMVETRKSMPVYFEFQKSETPVTEDIRIQVRSMVADEYKAIEMYTKIMNETNDAMAKKVIASIIDEERVHAGEFLTLLFRIDPKEAELYNKGSKELTGEL